MSKTCSDTDPYRLQEVSRLRGLPELDCSHRLPRRHDLHIVYHRCVENVALEVLLCNFCPKAITVTNVIVGAAFPVRVHRCQIAMTCLFTVTCL